MPGGAYYGFVPLRLPGEHRYENEISKKVKIAIRLWITLMCLNIGIPKTINFPFVPNGKIMVLGVPIDKPIRVDSNCIHYSMCE